jgi:hypothetical protein
MDHKLMFIIESIVVLILILYEITTRVCFNNETEYFDVKKVLPSQKVNIKLIPYFIPYNNPIHVSLKNPNIKKKLKHLFYNYMYVLPNDIFIHIEQKYKHIKKYFVFVKDSTKYVAFYVSYTTVIRFDKEDVCRLRTYTFKLHDTYVLGPTRIFNNIEDIIMSQGVERDMYGEKSISTVYLNELCSNKLEYVKYFVKHGLMIGTTIEPYKYGDIYNERYVKSPYSSRSACSQYEVLNNGCFVDDGVIVQQENSSLDMYEFKCYCLDGKLQMIILRREGGDYNICIPKDGTGLDLPIYNLVIKYLKNIEDLCTKAFYLMNNLVNMRIHKLNNDKHNTIQLVNDIKKSHQIDINIDKKIEYILTSLINSEKKKLINVLNKKYDKKYKHNVFTMNVVDYPEPDEYKIYDRFMRIDMALPDGHNYKKMTITEIEPFASGIYLNSTIKKCMKDDWHNEFNSIVQYNLHKIISTIPQ